MTIYDIDLVYWTDLDELDDLLLTIVPETIIQPQFDQF